ncbi:MAG: type 4a pilus biogenesis protein PilO [Candidatus Paceibacterota bacterium]|jgi:Tfp pilus assembly protein PilO
MTETTKQNFSILVITILIAASAYVFINFIRPEMEQRQSLAIEINEAQEKITMLKDYKVKFDLLTQNYLNLKDKINMIDQALPNDSQTAQVLATLDAISKKTSLPLNGLNFNTQTKDNFNILEIKTDFNASYDTFKIWIGEMEKELRLTDLNKINIKAVSSSSSLGNKTKTKASLLQFSLNLSTYFEQSEKQGSVE